QLEEQLNDLTDSIGAGDVSGYAQDAISFAHGARVSVLLFLFSVVLVIVIAIYMLLDMPRLEAVIDRRFPPRGGLPLTQRIERALWGYVKGQVVLSVVIGTSAGGGMWSLGTTGLVEGAERYALLFGIWTAFVEVIPYIGPWLSAVPPALYALVVAPVRVLWGRRPVGRRALRLHLPDRGAGGRPERDGERAPPPPAAGHLRSARRRRAVRDPRRARGACDHGRRARDLGALLRADPH